MMGFRAPFLEKQCYEMGESSCVWNDRAVFYRREKTFKLWCAQSLNVIYPNIIAGPSWVNTVYSPRIAGRKTA